MFGDGVSLWFTWQAPSQLLSFSFSVSSDVIVFLMCPICKYLIYDYFCGLCHPYWTIIWELCDLRVVLSMISPPPGTLPSIPKACGSSLNPLRKRVQTVPDIRELGPELLSRITWLSPAEILAPCFVSALKLHVLS